MTRRIRIHLGVGDLLETAGAGLACYALDRLAGLGFALLLAATFLIVAGNLIYGQRHISFGLPARRDFQMLAAALRRPFVRARLRVLAKARRK